jgi:hypothetical protein
MRHRFHSICPYFAMFPETFAEEWIDRLTSPGEIVADPFSGRGTTAFQSLLMGRGALANDTNPVAYVLSRAKTNAPSKRRLLERLDALGEQWLTERREPRPAKSPACRETEEFFCLAFASATLRQLLFLRRELKYLDNDTDCMLAALVLGSLHGDLRSPSYLSNQMPRTISTKPAYSVRYWRRHGLQPPCRDVFALLRARADFRYASPRPRRRGTVFLGDMRELPRKIHRGTAALVLTSPPYLDTTSYVEDQWLRYWFLGGPAKPASHLLSPDDRLTTRDAYWLFIGDMWRSLGYVVRDDGHVVIRIAGCKMSERELRDGLAGTSCLSGRNVHLRSTVTSPIIKRQTDSFRPGSAGIALELDCHFQFSDG